MCQAASKRSLQQTSPLSVKRCKTTCEKPRLSLDCTVPPRPLPQRLTSACERWSSPLRLTHNASLRAEGFISQSRSGQSTTIERRWCEDTHWPPNNHPYSANTSFMISCRTSVGSSRDFTSGVSSTQFLVGYDSVTWSGRAQRPSPLSSLIALIEATQEAIQELLHSVTVSSADGSSENRVAV